MQIKYRIAIAKETSTGIDYNWGVFSTDYDSFVEASNALTPKLASLQPGERYYVQPFKVKT